MNSESKAIMLLVVGLLSTLVIGMNIQGKTHTKATVSEKTDIMSTTKEDKPKKQEIKEEILKDTVKENQEEKANVDELAVATEEEIDKKVEPVVYDGLTMNQLSDKLNRSLNSTIAGKGHIFASESLALGIDPYLAVAIVLHETGCKWECSYLVRACNNVGGMKGSPGCNGGSYASFPTLDDGIRSYLSNLQRNYYAYGLNTPETIGPKYASSTAWPGKINWYIGSIRAN